MTDWELLSVIKHITIHSQTVDNSTWLSLVHCLFSPPPASLSGPNPLLAAFKTELVLCAHMVHEVSEVSAPNHTSHVNTQVQEFSFVIFFLDKTETENKMKNSNCSAKHIKTHLKQFKSLQDINLCQILMVSEKKTSSTSIQILKTFVREFGPYSHSSITQLLHTYMHIHSLNLSFQRVPDIQSSFLYFCFYLSYLSDMWNQCGHTSSSDQWH